MINVFHILGLRVWPIRLIVIVILIFNILILLIKFGYYTVFVNISLVLLILFWFKDVARERDYESIHGYLSNVFFKTGMILFIASEVIFFVSFFWGYFDFVIVVDSELGTWPPKGILRIRPFGVPLLNTLILLSSGVFITWAHFRILNNDWFVGVMVLRITLFLGVYFLLVQYMEYKDATYNFISRGYGRIFFLATGFHGFHVLLGCCLILGRIIRIVLVLMDAYSCYNFEFAAWYWHFVDVVWLFLFIFIYWWGF